MKYKILFVILVICFFAFTSFAQNENIEVSISMENTDLSGRKDLPVKVKITNKAENDLDTKKLKGISFCFAKRLKCNEPGSRGEHYLAFAAVPQKVLKKDDSFEFEINLKDLYWQDAISSFIDVKSPKNFATIPLENRKLSAIIQVFSHNITLYGTEIPISKSFISNQIFTTLKP